MLQQDRVGNPAVFPGDSLNIGPRRCEKDGNFNFLGPDDDATTGDENRNQVRPRAPGRDPYGPLSPLSRLPCWSPLEPLPEIESGDDMGGRVPPDGAEEGKVDEEMRREADEEKVLEEEDVLEWADSEEEFEFSCRSESSSLESADIGGPIWEEPQKAERRRESTGVAEDGSSDSDPGPEQPDLMEAVWTLQDRERFKAQEMEKHQVQLTMYRRLALIRWVRTLQSRVQEQQNRLQSSFDIILTHRKELLRMGSASTAP